MPACGDGGAFAEVTPAAYDRMFAIHSRAPFFAAQAAVRHMQAGGRIISIGTNMSRRVVAPGLSLGAASKPALSGMTRALARELGPLGITVNTVDPGSTDTDMNRRMGRMQRRSAPTMRWGGSARQTTWPPRWCISRGRRAEHHGDVNPRG